MKAGSVEPLYFFGVKNETAVFFRCGDLQRPAVVVRERPDHVLILLRSERDEHLSLHRDHKKGEVIVTLWSPDLASSASDAVRVEVARKLGFRHPERHGSYIIHRPLFPEPIIGADGQHSSAVASTSNPQARRPATKTATAST